jgi:hypothetical protein
VFTGPEKIDSPFAHGQAQIVMAMARQYGAFDAAHVRAQVGEQFAVLRRNRITDGVGHVQRAGAGLDHGAEDLGEESRIGARGILGGKLHIGAEAARQLHAGHGGLQRLGARDAQLVFEVDVGGGDEDMRTC